MNRLKTEKQKTIIRCLVDGMSMRATSRVTGCHRNTITRLMVQVAEGCKAINGEHLKDLECENVQVDEIWGFVKKKQRQLTVDDDHSKVGDFWTFVALDSDTKLVPSYLVGKRDAATTNAFMADLASRLTNRIQLSSDALNTYIDAVDQAFGGRVDYGQIVKVYESEIKGPGRYSPPKVVSAKHKRIQGKPVNVCTSHVERNNLTMRMNVRRLTRLTNAFSKKPEFLKAAIDLHFGYYNFVRIHQSLKVTPAMAAGVTPTLWTIEDLIEAGNMAA